MSQCCVELWDMFRKPGSLACRFLTTKFKFYGLGKLTYGTSSIYLHSSLFFMTLSTGRTYSKVYPSVSIITLSWFCHTLLHWYADSWHRTVWGPAVHLLFNPVRTSTRMHLGTCWLWTRNVSHVPSNTHVTSPDLILHVVILLFYNLQIQPCTITVLRLWNVPVWCFTCKLEYHSLCIQHLTQMYVKKCFNLSDS